MESLQKIAKTKYGKNQFSTKGMAKPSSFAKASEDDQHLINKGLIKKDSHLHSPAHLLADELSVKLNDRKHFGFYLKMALTHDHAFLRKMAGEILESKTVKTPGKLFAYLIKKYHRRESTN